MSKLAWAEAYRWFWAAMAFVAVGCFVYGRAWRVSSNGEILFLIAFAIVAGVNDVKLALAHRRERMNNGGVRPVGE